MVILNYDDGRLVDGLFLVDLTSYVQTRRVLLSNCDWSVDGSEADLVINEVSWKLVENCLESGGEMLWVKRLYNRFSYIL